MTPQKGSANNLLPAQAGNFPILGDGWEEKKEEGKPAASSCRPDGRVAERGPQAKVIDPSSLAESKNCIFRH